MLAALALPSTERPSPARPPQPAPPATPRFADMLQRGQATHGVLARPADPLAPPAQASPHSSTERAGTDDTTPSQAQDTLRQAAAKAGLKPGSRLREKAPPTMPVEPRAPDTPPADGAAARDAHDVPKAGDDAARTPPAAAAAQAADLRDWLAALKLSPAGTAATTDATTGAAAASGTDGSAPTAAPAAAAGTAKHVGARAGEDETAAPGNALAAADGEKLARLAMASEAVAASERRPTPADRPVVHDAAPTPLAGATGTVPRGFDAATLAPIALPAPLHSPEFAQVLGAQVSVLARDGVQQAELHLNPADMGPISVQIEIDGDHARVDFQANAAETRDVIERGLPELASALREQGLTLSGGGVFQHAPDRGDSASGSDGPPGRVGRLRDRPMEGASDVPLRSITLPVPHGRLDLYA